MASVINASNTAGLIVTPDNSGVLQFQANSVPSISIDVYGRPVLPVTGLPPVITPGAFEYANNVMYFTPAGTQRGLVPGMQYYRLNSNLVGTDTATSQNVFGLGVTLSSSTVYEFKGRYIFFRSAGITSHTFSTTFGGNVNINNIIYQTAMKYNTTAYNLSATGDTYSTYKVNSTPDGVTGLSVIANSGIVTTSGAVVYMAVEIQGTLSVNTGGTFLPQYNLSAAPGGAYTTQPGSYFYIYPIGPAGNVAIGTWA